jgi:uroporphyrin-III C-methyltransferase
MLEDTTTSTGPTNAAPAAVSEPASAAAPVAGGAPGPGWVALVGGGPGPADLITVRAMRVLARADVVVVDRLAPREILDSLGPRVEIVDAGKAPHGHNLTQAEINELIVDRARRGLGVVRLKGGDPFVFGRGGEEALACAAAGIACSVVPGVTSAVAVPGLAGIPVTHRGLTQDVSIVSGHVDPSHPGSTVDWAAVATGPGTVVILMGVTALAAIADELIKHGRPGTTPTAVIEAGGGPDERVTVGRLDEIAQRASAAGVVAPAVVVVGEVVALRDQLGLVGPVGSATDT